MESEIKVFCTPTEMTKVFDNPEKINIRYFAFIGVKTEGDVNPTKLTEEEFDKYKDKTCLYICRIRHEEFNSYLRGTKPYTSWNSVYRAIETRRKKRCQVESRL